jgi:uncharacterized protein YqjF (DUF2071 family)
LKTSRQAGNLPHILHWSLSTSRVFLTAEWRNLVLLSFPIERAVLDARLPRGLALDLWEGQALVSLVGFQFLHTKVLGAPAAPYRDFPEVNLRYYVRSGPKRGVVFIKEIVPHGVIAWLARTLYSENYVSLPMRTDVDPGRRAEYSWTLAERDDSTDHSIRVVASGPAAYPPPGSLEEFIIEHQWGYSVKDGGECFEYRVERPPWRVYPVESYGFRVDAGRVYGPEFAPALKMKPVSVILAEGSAISVSFGRKITDRSSSD